MPPISAEYVSRETVTNLWRNRLTTIAAMLTVAVSLSLVGATLLLRQGAAQAEVEWQRGTQVVVFMAPHAAPSEIASVRTQLAGLSYVDQPCTYWTHDKDFAEAKRTVGTSIITSADLTPATTPTSFRCTPVVPQDAQAVIRKFHGQPGVTTVTAPIASIHSEEDVINVLQIVFFVVAVVLLASAGVLILNTIRMAIFARRREVSVMKLVGATNWFIRLPFMTEGMIQGLVGSAVAAFAVWLLHTVLDHYGNSPGTILNQIRLTGWQVFGTDVVVVIVGVLVGTLGSAIAIRRFLDV